jgi:hypothetical protein
MPQAVYELRINDAAGTLQYIVTDFLYLQYRKEVNSPGLLVFSVTDNHQIVGNLDRDWQVEAWRSRAADGTEDNAITPYVDFYGFVRDEERRADSDGQTNVTYYCPGQMDLLRRSIIAYPAETTNRTKFISAKAETIAKTLVTRNATTSGTTADGRDRNVPTWGGYVSVQADGATGNTLDIFCTRRNLLDVLQEIARVGGGDFDLIKTAARAWNFRWYNGQRGTNRSASVVFALQYGNMSNPVLRRNRMNEATVAIVAGQGSEADRVFVVRTGTNYDASVNSYEILTDARDVTTTAGLNARGDARLDEMEAKDELLFNVIQTPGSLYGEHYFLGDLVTGFYQGITSTKQVSTVTIVLDSSGAERIDVELENA